MLDPSLKEVANAIEQWREQGCLPVKVRMGSLDVLAHVPVHVDATVDEALMSLGRKQGAGTFARATKDFSNVEGVLSRLANTRRVAWAVSRPQLVSTAPS
ncbi:hypothetical protein [Variovorax sp. AFSI2.2]|uniref:hypothetical protein n=1 Tax=Variovorax sp. AFSI2.2 TaxID=3384160 RepID=UPI003EBD63D2